MQRCQNVTFQLDENKLTFLIHKRAIYSSVINRLRSHLNYSLITHTHTLSDLRLLYQCDSGFYVENCDDLRGFSVHNKQAKGQIPQRSL